MLNGSAQKVSCNCYTLTSETGNQSGSVWNSNKINLQQSFDYWFTVFLGCKDGNGADGIVFILQPVSTSVGSSGGGMGFDGVRPSVGIALDTWQNTDFDDPFFDHISIQANGTIHHAADLVPAVQASSTSPNIEDCKWHVLRITWDAATKSLKAYFDGSLRVQKQIDLVADIFSGDPTVFWGFTAATGGAVNLQQFCTALNPQFTTNIAGNGGCEGAPVTFSDASESFAPITDYTWNFGDGTFSTGKTPLPHTYAKPGIYPVNLKIRGQDGCENDSTITITIGSVPRAAVSVFDTCSGLTPRVQVLDTNVGVSYQWMLDSFLIGYTRVPGLGKPGEGEHTLEVMVSSAYGCGAPAVAASTFTIKPLPQVVAAAGDGCIGEDIFFSGLQSDSKTTVSKWLWTFGDGAGTASQQATHRYTTEGQYTGKLWALATNGCTSDTALTTVIINAAKAFAGNDTAVTIGVPLRLNGSGNGTFLWWPPNGLSNPAVSDPLVTPVRNQEYTLTVTTAEGCSAHDTVMVKAYKGPAVYVPTAFTPNGDGKNETLRPVYVGVKELKQFAVYNRWGQQLFSTKEVARGWEGKGMPGGTYVWIVQAVDASGKVMVVKGTVTIVK